MDTEALSLSNAPASAPDVSAVVVNRDGGEALTRCLDSLAGQRGVALETAVVDNASAEEERRRIAAAYPAARLVTFSRNLGFARGANEGISRTSGRFVLLLNNDARVAPDYAARLAARLDLDDSLAAVQGIVLKPDGRTVDTAGIVWSDRGEALPFAGGRDRFEVPTEAIRVPGVSATAAMYRRSALEEIARDGRVFEEAFFAYYEDVELSLRLSRAGWKLALDPEAIAVHEGSRTGSRMPWRRAFWTARNRWRTLGAHFDRGFLLARLPALAAADLAHARRLGPAGWPLPALVWPGAALTLLSRRRGGPRLDAFPPSPPLP